MNAQYLDTDGQDVKLDEEGYLRSLADWRPEVAEQLAQAEAIELTQAHWEILNLLRAVYDEYQHTPVTRVFVKMIGEQLGSDKGRSMYLLKLFPETPMRKACKIAGLPKPTNCF